MLYGDILTIYGKAGVGKSQLLASKTQSLLNEGRIGVLLVAGIYFTDDPVHEQIMKNLRLDYSFEDLIDILETIGERDNCIIPIFIDALNETWNRKLWKSGLLAIIDNSNFAHRFCLCTLKIQYLAVIQLSKVCCYAA